MVGSRTFLFWASQNDDAGKQAEESIFNMFGFSDQEDDPNRNIEQVRKVFSAIYSGEIKTTSEDRFFILGLAPNSARIAVVYWAELPLREFAATISKHFEDMEMIDTRVDKKPYLSLRNILSAVTLGGKVSDVTPNLPEAVVKSIFQGLPYPHILFASCIRRVRAESGDKERGAISITRAAIIKAYLNRISKTQEIKVMLDKENTNQGYLCGRLFAVLDKIQEEANNQHSIRERRRQGDESFVMTEECRKEFLTAWQKRKKEMIEHPFLKEKIPIGLLPYTQAMLLARFLRDDLDDYPVFLMR